MSYISNNIEYNFLFQDWKKCLKSNWNILQIVSPWQIEKEKKHVNILMHLATNQHTSSIYYHTQAIWSG